MWSGSCSPPRADAQSIGYGTVAADTLYLRSQPNTDSEILAELPDGATFQITSNDTEGWYGVSFDGQSGYVSADYVSLSDAVNTGYVQTTVHPVVLRAGAGSAFAALAEIPEGTVLPVSGSYGSWYRVSYEGYVGYVSGGYVCPTTENGYAYYPGFAQINRHFPHPAGTGPQPNLPPWHPSPRTPWWR